MLRTFLSLALLAAALPALAAQDSPAKPELPAAEPFTCETADGVTIVGDFYPPGRGRGQRAPCVLLLHPVGPGKQNSSRRDFGSLPKRLQAEGLAVVAFDFRGYGDSQAADAAKPAGKEKGGRLDPRDFRTLRDWGALANDLVAVKVWLNGKNNAKACNSHCVAVVAAEQSGLVALAWLANEHQDVNRALDRSAVKNNRADRFEGQDVVSVAWIAGADRLGAERMDPNLLQRWLFLLRDNRTQTFALVSEGDAGSKQFWDKAQNWIKPAKDKENFQQTKVRRVKGTPLTGLKLLEHEAFETLPELIEFLDQSLAAPNRNWEEHKGNPEATTVNYRSLVGP